MEVEKLRRLSRTPPPFDPSRYVYQALDSQYSPELAPMQVFDSSHNMPRPVSPPEPSPEPPEAWFETVNGIVWQVLPPQSQ